MQALAILFGSAFTVLAATALGARILGNHCRDYPVRFVVGAAALSLVVFILACLHLIYPVSFLVAGVAAILLTRPIQRYRAATASDRSPAGVPSTRTELLLLLPLTAYFLLYFFNSMAPEVSPDGATYHLGWVNRYFVEHGFHRITTSMYAALSQGMEMLFLFAFAFGRHSAATMVHFAFLVALIWQMVLYGRRAGMGIAGPCAALLMAASPLVGLDGISAYNDVALAVIAFTLFYLLEMWDSNRDRTLLIAIGLVAGFAYAVKYTGFVAVVYGIGFVWWKSRRWRDLLIVGAGAALLVAPWMLKDWIWLHNPVAPFFNRYFENPYITISSENYYRDWLTLYDLPSRWRIPLEVTTRGGLGGVLGPVFLLAPIALLALRKKQGRRLLLAAAVFGCTYFSNIGARFLIPPLPFVALALAMVLATVPVLAIAVALIHAVFSWPALVTLYCPPEAWRLQNQIPWHEALRRRDRAEKFVRARRIDYDVTRMVENLTPPGATIFMYRPIPWAYTTRRVLIQYESAETDNLDYILRGAFASDLAPTCRLRWTFPSQQLAGVRLVTAAPGADQWAIKELRFLSAGQELPRANRWRLTAHPFPWTIQDAFDNSPLTEWRSGETIRPGMSVEVDFVGSTNVDGVLLEAPPNSCEVALRVEGRRAGGAWIALAGAPETARIPPALGLRRAAIAELKRHGVDYILLFDEEFCAGDFRDKMDLWGVRQVGATGGARLYQLP